MKYNALQLLEMHFAVVRNIRLNLSIYINLRLEKYQINLQHIKEPTEIVRLIEFERLANNEINQTKSALETYLYDELSLLIGQLPVEKNQPNKIAVQFLTNAPLFLLSFQNSLKLSKKEIDKIINKLQNDSDSLDKVRSKNEIEEVYLDILKKVEKYAKSFK